jgi:hypothetical protein
VAFAEQDPVKAQAIIAKIVAPKEKSGSIRPPLKKGRL